MFYDILISGFLLAVDGPGIMVHSCIGKSLRGYTLFWSTNVALDSHEVDCFMFGKATALKSWKRIIISLSTRQHIHKNILFLWSTNHKTYTSVYNGRYKPILIYMYLQQLCFMIFLYQGFCWLSMALELWSILALESHCGDTRYSDPRMLHLIHSRLVGPCSAKPLH